MNKIRVAICPPAGARWGTILGAALLGSALAALGQDSIQLQWRESGIHEQASGFRPHGIALSTNAPARLQHAPKGLTAPLYGSFEIGPPKAPATIGVILDFAPDKTQRLFVDSNGNGDFTDDPACVWTNRVYQRPDGTETSSWTGSAPVVIPFASGPRRGQIILYSGGPVGPAGASQPRLFYYADYGLAGDLKIGDRAIAAVLQDAGGSGYFHLSSETMATPLLWLDITNAGRAKGRTFVASRPFEVDGKWWAMTNLTPEGAFQIVASTKPSEPEKTAGPDLSPGKPAPAFTAKRTDGKPVQFPADYKGKVVLVDFWATWCGPCVAELPNVVKAYEKYHDQGLEVLGISLDREEWEQKLADFTQKKGMPWPQVYDGKYWSAAVAKLYGINSIPHMILVDGDSGVILADKTIRGELLAPAIEKALAARKK